MIESRRGEEEAEDGLSLKATFSEKLFDVTPLSAASAAPEPGQVLKKKTVFSLPLRAVQLIAK